MTELVPKIQYLLCLLQSVIMYISSPAADEARLVCWAAGPLALPGQAAEQAAGVKRLEGVQHQILSRACLLPSKALGLRLERLAPF